MVVDLEKLKEAVNFGVAICGYSGKSGESDTDIFQNSMNLEIGPNGTFFYKNTGIAGFRYFISKENKLPEESKIRLVFDIVKLKKILSVSKADTSEIEISFDEKYKEIHIKGDYTSRLAIYGKTDIGSFDDKTEKLMPKAVIPNVFNKETLSKVTKFLGFIKDAPSGNNHFNKVFIKNHIESTDGAYYFEDKSQEFDLELPLLLDSRVISLLKTFSTFEEITFFDQSLAFNSDLFKIEVSYERDDAIEWEDSIHNKVKEINLDEIFPVTVEFDRDCFLDIIKRSKNAVAQSEAKGIFDFKRNKFIIQDCDSEVLFDLHMQCSHDIMNKAVNLHRFTQVLKNFVDFGNVITMRTVLPHLEVGAGQKFYLECPSFFAMMTCVG